MATKVFTEEELAISQPDSLKVLGSWARSEAALDRLREEFCTAKPYEHVIIDNFLSEDVANQVNDEFPSQDDRNVWHCIYNNPLEKKLACNRFDLIKSEHIKKVLKLLNAPEVVKVMEKITGFNGLNADPYLHGGGIHMYPHGAKLDVHLDYSIHPHTGMERRVNLILYMSHWDESWGGATEFWNDDMTKCEAFSHVKFNRGLIFRTNDISYHGLPDPIMCPDDQPRKSLAVYYVSEPRPDAPRRMKAQYVRRPQDVPSEMYDRLRELRPNQLLTKKELEGWVEEEQRILVEEMKRNEEAGREIYPPHVFFRHTSTH